MTNDGVTSSSQICEQWKALVKQYLGQYLFETAKFYAERYFAESPNEVSLHHLALCYYRLGKLKQTYLLLSESKYLNSAENKYLFAQVCVHLGKYDEAEYVLHANNRLMFEEEFTKESMIGVPGGAGGLYLMGKICRRQQRKDSAIQYFKLALEIDPFFWSAIVELSELGVDFKIDELMTLARDQSNPQHKTASPRVVTRSKKQQSTISRSVSSNRSGIASSNRDLDNQAAKAFLLHTAENLYKMNNPPLPTPIAPANTTLDYSTNSVVSIKLPFATPSSLPSPITASMLSVGRQGNLMPDTTSMVISPYDTHHQLPISDDVSGNLMPSTSLHLHNTSEGVRGILNTGDVNIARAPLFGLPTPMTADQASVDFEGDQSTIMELNSAFHTQRTGGGGGGGERRRVSFGPTARLSFSGAFDSHLPNPSLLDSFEQSSKIVTAETDDHPHKLQRSDPTNRSPTTSNKGKVAGNSDRAPPSPFPMALASPIHGGNVSALQGGDDVSRHHLSVSKPYESLVYDESSILADSKGNSSTPFPAHSSLPLPPSAVTSGTSPRTSGKTSSTGARGSIASTLSSGGSNSSEVALALYEIDESIWTIVSTFARALQQINAYSCIESIDTLAQLPPPHYQTAYVSQLIGRACTEMNEYKGAVIAFREMRRLEPYRIQGLEIYSSALWHLREDKELAMLSHQVNEIDKYSAETWCVIGNCYSLQKETDIAIKFFQRSLQIDPYFTYAHTLCGHEHVNNEDMDKAIISFRSALLCNDRHYNAWYGLGSIYYRQERFEMSEYHFRRARNINPRSSVLDCYLGMALNAQGSYGKIEEALEVLNEASIRDPQNPQLRFQRAHILFSQDRLVEALDELLLVEKFAPKEPPVHAMLGQIYQRQGETQKALLHLNIAMDLDPKEINSLKAILENFEEPQLVA